MGGFFAVYARPPYKGLRVNALKISAAEFEKISPFPLRPVPWAENGFYTDGEKTGAHAYHFAGLYYSQEPSAMCAAPLLDAKPNERVLDLCSAPGGKGTQLAAAMKGEGILVLNEPIFSRAQILSRNVERLGVKNAVVLSEYPETLAEYFPEYFDKILVDAPCSGEGMFRKNAEEALSEWREENVAMCAARQKEILDYAFRMLKAGGKLVYSTCTFSEAEDEEQTKNFLASHAEMRLLAQKNCIRIRRKGRGISPHCLKRTHGRKTRTEKTILRHWLKRKCGKNTRKEKIQSGALVFKAAGKAAAVRGHEDILPPLRVRDRRGRSFPASQKPWRRFIGNSSGIFSSDRLRKRCTKRETFCIPFRKNASISESSTSCARACDSEK